MLLSFFGAMWWVAGSLTHNGTVRIAALTTGLLIAAVLFVAAFRRLGTDGEREAYKSGYATLKWSNAAQGAGIAAVIVLGNVAGIQNAIPALIAVVVGIHFYPLAGAFGRPEYRWTGSLIIGAGGVGAVAALADASISTALSVTALCASAALWGTTVWYLRSPLAHPSTNSKA